ncbi:MAG: RecX family transcriptional regulator [Ruminococcaceae bacterium]|nr:RecX family transcriptional regulator [Oscillospiraceae bacterium]
MVDKKEKAEYIATDRIDSDSSELWILSYVPSDDKTETYTVRFDNGEILEVSAEEFFENSLYETERPVGISFGELVYKVYSKRAFYEGVRFVLFSKKTVSQVHDHLSGLGFDEDCRDYAVKSLTEEGYLDDVTYTQKFIRKAVDSRIVSCMMIVCELKQKGIEENVVRECLADMDIDDIYLAKRAVAKKTAVGVNDTVKIRRFLMGKGFTGEAIRKALGSDDFE